MRKVVALGISLIFIGLIVTEVYFSTSTFGIDTGGAFIQNSVSKKLKAKFLITKILFFEGARELKEFASLNCGGGSGCYDLGYALLQILDRLGDEKFCSLLENAQINRSEFLSLLSAGVEYGDPKGVRNIRLSELSDGERSDYEGWGPRFFPRTFAFLKSQ